MSINRIEQMKENTKELNLLVVEDNKVFHGFYKKLLEKYFRNYYTAMDGLEGLNLYSENPNKYDIIIADHQMPRMDGLEMITEIKKINPDAHVIFITGTSETEVLTQMTHMSIDAIIAKPVSKIQLLTKIDDVARKIIDKRHMHLYIEQLEQMNHAVWTLKEKIRQKIRPLEYMPHGKNIFLELEALLNKPVALVDDILLEDEASPSDIMIHQSDEVDENFDVEKAMQEYNEKQEKKVEEYKSVMQYDDAVNHPDIEHEGRFKDIRYSVVDKISAEEFVSEVDEGTFSELDDFREDLDNFNMLLNDMSLCEPSHFYGYLDQVAEFYHRLFMTINTFVVFSAIENTFNGFASFIEGITREELEDMDKQNILVDALFALSDDLSKWIKIVFYDKNTDNIHYFDASFANTCLEIESMFAQEEAIAAEDEEDLLEFF